MPFAELFVQTNFSFLYGASRPEELVKEAKKQNYSAIAITDECSLAGVVKAFMAAREEKIHLITGSYFRCQPADDKADNPLMLVLLAQTKKGYSQISSLITLARRRSEKGSYFLNHKDLQFITEDVLAIWLPTDINDGPLYGDFLKSVFGEKLWIGVRLLQSGNDEQHYDDCYTLAATHDLPMLACNQVLMHSPQRKRLLDTLTAIRLNQPVQQLGTQLQKNAEHYLRPIDKLKRIYPRPLLEETARVADLCQFELSELRYCYPKEVVPDHLSPASYLQQLVMQGAESRYPNGIPEKVSEQIKKELRLIHQLKYEYYFLTVYDVVAFARSRDILCQGRGSAANSVVCYCLFITEVDPNQIDVLFERFISVERNEPPDIDVDFEHERREEVIQYIYQKYTRERAALAATVITYRRKSAVRDVGKALGFDAALLQSLNDSLGWWHQQEDLVQRFKEAGFNDSNQLARLFLDLVKQILGYPRHLSQHVGGFVISDGPLSELVPVENATMPDRTVIQWDKDDIEALALLKVDVLALGMLTALRKALTLVQQYDSHFKRLQDIPKEDPKTYQMLSRGDSVGVFQVESRAQMNMLPRLKPKCFYDLVVEVAIVRPGPILGDMVHPYLRRRDGDEAIEYPSKELEAILKRTLGVPIFQEQVIKVAMVAAGFSGGEADQLRRAMASWGKNGYLYEFKEKFIRGMTSRGYSQQLAERIFKQMEGFGGYGFPESHSASFAILVYFSAWLKCHHPAAFYCALLNSQPMGFYSPSQLVQDARRHRIAVFPVDAQHSDWEAKLEKCAEKSTQGWGIRLGLQQIKGFGEAAAQRLIKARPPQGFSDLQQLAQLSQLTHAQLETLAAANALSAFNQHRYHAYWQTQQVELELPLLKGSAVATLDEPPEALQPPGVMEDMFADYSATGLTLNHHPLHLLRTKAPFAQCVTAKQLKKIRHKSLVKVAGLVTCRQRPGTASGVLFLTLEDETGNTNVVVWNATQQYFRKEILKGNLLLIKGVAEREKSVVHVIAGHIKDCSDALSELASQSRDFH